jgi:hypothetical protein
MRVSGGGKITEQPVESGRPGQTMAYHHLPTMYGVHTITYYAMPSRPIQSPSSTFLFPMNLPAAFLHMATPDSAYMSSYCWGSHVEPKTPPSEFSLSQSPVWVILDGKQARLGTRITFQG